MISTGDFKRGIRILIEGDPYVILDVFVQTPSARGASSLTKVKVRNLRTGQVLDKTFRGGDRVDEPNLELRPVQFLYKDGEGFHFMDTQSYDQFQLSPDEAGDLAGYLREGLEGIRSVVFNERVISIDLPNITDAWQHPEKIWAVLAEHLPETEPNKHDAATTPTPIKRGARTHV